jgi:hypothetical protein
MNTQTDRQRTLLDLSPLHRPLWWAALALLLINDNLLKGGGVAPGWLTGKLSDFAFLVVAPVLLAALLPRALPRRRAIALGAIVSIYAAADLSASVSEAILAAAHWIGLPWRLWPDVTDLVALSVLPLTWRLMRPPRAQLPASPRSRPLMESAGVFAGAFACLATSAPDAYPRAPYLVNQTAQPRQITATWLLRPTPCDGDLAAFAASLTPSDLDDPHSATLASGDVAVLDSPPPPEQPLKSVCPGDHATYGRYGYGTSCTGVVVQAGSDLSVLAVYPLGWNESDGAFITCFHESPKSQCKAHYSLKQDPGPDSLALRERDGKLVLSVGTGSQVRVVVLSPATIAVRTPDPQGCRPLLAEQDQVRNAASACRIDTDCRAVQALPVPGRACVIYGNQSLTVTALRTRWNQRGCVVDPDHNRDLCPPPQPAVCLNGRCQEVCPGVSLPTCPLSCATDAGVGSTCYYSVTCANPDGTWCSCQQGKYTCAPQPRPAGCALTCVPWTDPYASPPAPTSQRDGGPPSPWPDSGIVGPADVRPDTSGEAPGDSSDSGL